MKTDRKIKKEKKRQEKLRVQKGQKQAMTAKQKDSMKRQKAFMEDIKASSAKHKCDLIASMQYKPMGAIPVMSVVDVKDKYEQMTAEAKKAEALKKQDVPKLEV